MVSRLNAILITCLLGIVSLPLTAATHTVGVDHTEHRVWTREPIVIDIPVNGERRIDFPVGITLDVPESINTPHSRIQITPNGSVYWSAFKPWTYKRVLARSRDNALIYVIDIAATPNAPSHPLAIVDPTLVTEESSNDTATRTTKRHYDYVDLTRLAAQQLYAPLRLATPLEGVTRVPVNDMPVALLRGGMVRAQAVVQWRANQQPARYVTAVKLRNITQNRIAIDPRTFRGQWLFAAPQHPVLEAHGTLDDFTHVYLVSEQPYEASIFVPPPPVADESSRTVEAGDSEQTVIIVDPGDARQQPIRYQDDALHEK